MARISGQYTSQLIRLFFSNFVDCTALHPGGCGPFGLALAAHRRGFGSAVIVSDPGVHMVDSVRSPEKQEVMALVQI